MLTITPEDHGSFDSVELMKELSMTLTEITGDSGQSSFDPDDVRTPNAFFVIARNLQGQAVGCGAFRPLQNGVAEVKRMYSRPGTSGVGSAILAFLEAEAKTRDYQALWLETRVVNHCAVSFYERREYKKIPNFGKYIGNTKAVCFEKWLTRRSSGAAQPA
ncbi:GNAT family N-acetyltransferase [Iodobacter sp. CM08]|uniref:GNAT family N-acetyltransferase n=1 Tax=Iodobacter sp. CM08 TaxID=3085902 RepID=UPI002982ABBC|nr:GNAT family N-acetyltransferase [Iodobacter sp. CM08]MDW5418720.1 GNAT family N-acetyltransferase [Iodobacter sp. CM08]